MIAYRCKPKELAEQAGLRLRKKKKQNKANPVPHAPLSRITDCENAYSFSLPTIHYNFIPEFWNRVWHTAAPRARSSPKTLSHISKVKRAKSPKCWVKGSLLNKSVHFSIYMHWKITGRDLHNSKELKVVLKLAASSQKCYMFALLTSKALMLTRASGC